MAIDPAARTLTPVRPAQQALRNETDTHLPAKVEPKIEKPGDTYEAAKKAPVDLGNTNATAAAANDVTTYSGGIDRRQFLAELQRKPELITKAAWMVRGEVGAGAPLASKISILETAFNRSQVRGHSLEHGLLSVGESKRGYYARDTYRGNPPTAAELADFKKNVLAPVLAGSDVTSYAGYGPMTGNASGSVALHQRQRGTPGYGMKIAGGQTEYLFNEEHKDLRNGKYLARLDDASALDAAKKAHEAIPGGVFPVGPTPSAVTGGTTPDEARTNYGTNKVGRRGVGKGKRTYNPMPLQAPPSRSQPGQSAPGPQMNALTQLLTQLGLSPEQISQLLGQAAEDPAFKSWLGNRQASPELLQQYFNEQPDKLQQLLGGTGQSPMQLNPNPMIIQA